MRQALREGKDIIVKVDVQGTETIKKKIPQAIAIFLKPPSMENLEQRLRGRSSESSDNMNIRLKKAKDEIQKAAFFDYIVTNYQDEVDKVIAKIQNIVDSEKQKGRGNTKLVL
jgi:guanylate kinase